VENTNLETDIINIKKDYKEEGRLININQTEDIIVDTDRRLTTNLCGQSNELKIVGNQVEVHKHTYDIFNFKDKKSKMYFFIEFLNQIKNIKTMNDDDKKKDFKNVLLQI